MRAPGIGLPSASRSRPISQSRVADLNRGGNIVRHQNESAEFVRRRHFRNELHDALLRQQVQSRKRFVHQQKAFAASELLRDGSALPLSARQAARDTDSPVRSGRNVPANRSRFARHRFLCFYLRLFDLRPANYFSRCDAKTADNSAPPRRPCRAAPERLFDFN